MNNQERIEKLVGQINKYYTDAGFVKNVSQQVLDLLNDGAQASQWIPCSERLPEGALTTTLVCLKNGQVFRAEYSTLSDRWLVAGVGAVENANPAIAWMPLPNPYQPDDKEQRINAVAKSFQSFVEKNAEGLVNAVEVKHEAQ